MAPVRIARQISCQETKTRHDRRQAVGVSGHGRALSAMVALVTKVHNLEGTSVQTPEALLLVAIVRSTRSNHEQAFNCVCNYYLGRPALRNTAEIPRFYRQHMTAAYHGMLFVSRVTAT